jgi:hypothetical protein
MNNIEKYRKRFYTLMESEMGNAKPLINEEDNNNPYTAVEGTLKTTADGKREFQIMCRTYQEKDECFVHTKPQDGYWTARG